MDRKFLAAKVNINGNIFSPNASELIELIPEAIKAGKIYKSKSSTWDWEFTDLEEINYQDYKILKGNFTKSRKETKRVVKDQKIELFEIPDKVAYPSLFIYDPITEILVFEETGDIQRQHFIDAFEKLVYQSNYAIGKIDVNLITKKDELYHKIMEIEVLTKIEFELIPPNMIDKDTYKDLSDIIKKEKATRLKTSLENDRGLNKHGNLIQNGIEMVSTGYGEVKAYGFNELPSRRKGKKKRERKVYKSRDSVEIITEKKATSEDALVGKLSKFLQKVKIRNFSVEERKLNE